MTLNHTLPIRSLNLTQPISKNQSISRDTVIMKDPSNSQIFIISLKLNSKTRIIHPKSNMMSSENNLQISRILKNLNIMEPTIIPSFGAEILRSSL